MSEELANIFSAAERLIDQLDNPLHIAIMENYRMHAMLEYCGRFEELLAPEMTIERPVYRICTPQTGYRVYDGMDEVRNEFYAPLVEHGQTVQTKEQEHLAVNDWGFSQEQFVHQHLRGRAARTKGHDIDDRDLDGYFIEDHWTSMYFIYNDEARLIGEHIYHSPATDLREITVDEFYDLEQLRAVLEPKIAAGPHRRLSVGSGS
ncbi:hypothetical protein [Mycolicibacterium pyrenivorans]|uniref:hypothetical protein n=1 Tax=Mycolicibacterium pyrenivorans TaxID=187102 RepID=UPI0021F320A7|nr:hypothetical protein [Mycolicibacterium pyrenivorans]MCV7149969.1 hypothetical protein [Mycolicibacterium pyrenivorans]